MIYYSIRAVELVSGPSTVRTALVLESEVERGDSHQRACDSSHERLDDCPPLFA